jgi:hypothetical protein
MAGDALDLCYLDQGMIIRRASVVAKVIVPRRNEDLAD